MTFRRDPGLSLHPGGQSFRLDGHAVASAVEVTDERLREGLVLVMAERIALIRSAMRGDFGIIMSLRLAQSLTMKEISGSHYAFRSRITPKHRFADGVSKSRPKEKQFRCVAGFEVPVGLDPTNTV